MGMGEGQTWPPHFVRRLSAVGAAAVLLLFLLGCAVVGTVYGQSIQSWFAHYWQAVNHREMSQGQAALIDHLTQDINQSQTVDGVTVTVDSATVGDDTPIGTYKTYVKYRWKFMHDNIYCQYLCRFKDGFLLHSVIYLDQPDSYHLNAGSYNYLGKIYSDGCIRMVSGNAAWIYNSVCGLSDYNRKEERKDAV